jgi:DNA polymerase III alpha subunit
MLFFDGSSTYAPTTNFLEKILQYGPDSVFSTEEQTGIEVKKKSDALPQIEWNIPQEYLERDIEQELMEIALQVSPEAVERVKLEFALYRERKMIPLLQTLLYVRDRMIEKNVIWGVGRGSSVASYVLFMMDIHEVDSLKYGLSIEEFLR